MIMDKKANILDWFYIIIILFLVGVTTLTAYLIINNASMDALWATDPNAEAVVGHSKAAILSFDNIMLFIIVGLSLFVLISAALVFHHVAFFIVSFFLLCIAVMFAAVTSNTFWKFTSQSTIAGAAAAFPKIAFLMENIPLYIAFMGVAVLVVMYIAYSRE